MTGLSTVTALPSWRNCQCREQATSVLPMPVPVEVIKKGFMRFLCKGGGSLRLFQQHVQDLPCSRQQLLFRFCRGHALAAEFLAVELVDALQLPWRHQATLTCLLHGGRAD